MAQRFDDIESRIADVAEALTPAERDIAAVIAEDPTAVAFATVAELAGRAATSGPTVVRFATKLGFDGYTEMQAATRRSLAEHITTPTDRIRRQHHGSAWSAAQAALTTAIASTSDELDDERLDTLATPIVDSSGAVWIVASETSSPVAHVLAANLRLVRPGVRHLFGSPAAIAAAIVDAGPDDVVIAIDFQRYEQTVTATTRLLADAGVTVVALTDGPLSPLTRLAHRWVTIPVPAVGPFDSALPVLAVVEALAAEVASRLRRDATGRLDRIEHAWADYDVFGRAPR